MTKKVEEYIIMEDDGGEKMYIERGCQYKRVDLVKMYRFDFDEKSCMTIPITSCCGVISISWGLFDYAPAFIFLGVALILLAVVTKLTAEVMIRKRARRDMSKDVVLGRVIVDDDELMEITPYGVLHLYFSELCGYVDRGDCMYLYRSRNEVYCLTRDSVFFDWTQVVMAVAAHCDQMNMYPRLVEKISYSLLAMTGSVAALFPCVSILTLFSR